MDPFSAGMLDSLWLTAQRWDDPDLRQARAALPETVVARIERDAARRSGLERGAKARAVQRIVDGARPPVSSEAVLPARGLALLAAQVPRDAGRRWVREAPAPRAGFRPLPGLRGWLARMARQGVR